MFIVAAIGKGHAVKRSGHRNVNNALLGSLLLTAPEVLIRPRAINIRLLPESFAIARTPS
jgi:hypothetical protein